MWSKRMLLIAAVIAIALPGAALAFYKPSRVLVPHWFGVQCPTSQICIDDLSRLSEAEGLVSRSVDFVNQNIGHMRTIPRVTFCSTQVCADKFGFYHAATYNVGTVGIVIRTKGWTEYFVRHELIHHLQNERLGSVRMALFKPKWFTEGMAYALSEDPRRPIPDVVLEGYRRAFETWHDGSDIWVRAKDL